jgi:uncharacterized phiE125 gp8 family phage protein
VGLVQIEAPAATPVSTAEAQLQVRSEDPALLAHLGRIVDAATARAEAYCRRRFVSQKWRETFDEFPTGCRTAAARRRALVLSHPPLISVQAVKYIDANGVEQTVSSGDYVTRTSETPGEIVPVYGKEWPTPRSEPGAVRVDFTCGYGAAVAVPSAIRQAILILVATTFDNPASVITGTIATELPQSALWLLDPYRVTRF